jgi:N-ethylmaleimide reductase
MSTPAIAPAVAARYTPGERLFHPVELGRYDLPHRMVMAPLTRSRARQPGNVPSPLNACYYAQRASAALIVSEATQVSQQGQGYAWTPGIHSSEPSRAGEGSPTRCTREQPKPCVDDRWR